MQLCIRAFPLYYYMENILTYAHQLKIQKSLSLFRNQQEIMRIITTLCVLQIGAKYDVIQARIRNSKVDLWGQRN